jgi:2-polyprenyl-3-methyl-5-hydroxy-6-metoxy-1,4-benzoquinol methylase
MSLKSTYDRIAYDWIEDHKNDTWWNNATQKFISYLNIGDTILDVGCAGGIKTKFFVNQGFSVVGIDLSDKMIKIAKEMVPNGKFFVKDIRVTLDLDCKFNGIFAQAVLLHIPKSEIKVVLKNLYQDLQKNGYFYLAVKEIRIGQAEEQVIKENDYGYDYERFFSFYSLTELENYIKELNMEIVYSDVISYENTNWVQMIAKK